MRSRLGPVLAMAFLLAAPRPAHAAFGRDPYTPVTVAPTGFQIAFNSAVSDGSGGMLVAWTDARLGNPHVYVQRYTGTGAVAAGWPVGGLQVCTNAAYESTPSLLGDGVGGALVAWGDARGATLDIYATRVLGNGTVALSWPANGLLVSTSGLSASKDEYNPALTTDGAGGAFVLWTLQYGTGDQDVYGAHVASAGTVAWSWGLFAPLGMQSQPKPVADGAGGCYVGFSDNNNGSLNHAKVMRVSAAGSLTWGPSYIGTGPSANQYNFDIAPDGSGGVYGVCSDNGPATFTNITGNHFLASGANDPGWGGYKFLAYEPNINQGGPIAAADGSGGLFVGFIDGRYGNSDAFVQRIGPYGFAYAGWPAGGVALTSMVGNHFPLGIAPDGAGGVIVSFLDNRYADYFLYASRVQGNGTLAPGWTYSGNPVDLGGLIDVASAPAGLVPDGAGGALFAWADTRGVAPYTGYAGVFAQNIDRFGAYGDARPFITRIADVPLDQGGQVSLQWTASYLDATPSRTVTQYTIWRRVPGGTAAAAASRAASATADRPAWRTSVDGAQVVYWEYLSTQQALMLPGYSVVVPTTSDSMTAGNPRTSFMVVAESPGNTMFWSSPPDSGYSVDNIPPYAPAPFAGTYLAGTASLHWRADVVPDLANYRLYRGTTSGFVPGPSNQVASPVDTAYADAAGAPYYYRLTAVDIHGNESASTLLLPQGALAVEGALPAQLAFAAPAPNPARGSTVLRFSLPRDASVRLALYDVSGRRVRTLVQGAQAAGEHAAPWDLRDDEGRAVGAGLYFARLEAEGRTFTQRVMTLR
jgi:hypothetical protein